MYKIGYFKVPKNKNKSKHFCINSVFIVFVYSNRIGPKKFRKIRENERNFETIYNCRLGRDL